MIVKVYALNKKYWGIFRDYATTFPDSFSSYSHFLERETNKYKLLSHKVFVKNSIRSFMKPFDELLKKL